MKLTRLTGETIVHEILSTLEELQTTVENMRGQGYNGEAICLLELLECRHVSKRNHLLQHMCIVVDTVISHSCALPKV